ncbi:MAG: hypothetical protein ACTHXA_04560 [Gulosibacter sp.]|uniref:hypothetical protein n=1 Tax=Gulosibacter sp. TaxID=2817531 RepID=UPI003F8E4A96
MSTNTSLWTAEEEQAILRIADLLIPGDSSTPKASATADYIDAMRRICEIRPDLIEPTRRLVNEFAAVSALSVEFIREKQPDLFIEVSELFAGAYFVDDQVLETLEYRNKQTIPLDDENQRVAELNALVRPVMERGNIWRETAVADAQSEGN